MNNCTRQLWGKRLKGLALACAFAGQFAWPEARANVQILKALSPYPRSALTRGPDEALYGVTLSTVFKLNADGTGFGVVYNFTLVSDDPAFPRGPLLLGSDRAFYGVREGAGTGAVTVFKLNTDGTGYKALYISTNDLSHPQAPLVQGTDGALYGTTSSGGINGYGTVFKLNTDGTGFSILHSFPANTNDGVLPQAPLVQGSDGTLYGTTSSGGTNGYGTVFKLNTDGTGFSVLHSFPASTNDVLTPTAALMQGNDGALYGTTAGLGISSMGTVFRLNVDGTSYQVLHTFDNTMPGTPQSALVQGVDGSIYGLTSMEQGPGMVFRLNPDGTGYALLHVFADFVGPYGPLLLGTDGAFYGATYGSGGVTGGGPGTVFRMTVPPPPPPFVISIMPMGGSLQIGFDGAVGATYRFETSTNLLDWVTLGTVLNENGPVQFLDVNQTKPLQQFYRAVWAP